jgi:hypothetical protein
VRAREAHCRPSKHPCVCVSEPAFACLCLTSNITTWLHPAHCRELIPRPYVTADAVMEARGAAARTVQRFARGWRARKRVRELREQKAQRDAFLEAQVAVARQEEENARR